MSLKGKKLVKAVRKVFVDDVPVAIKTGIESAKLAPAIMVQLNHKLVLLRLSRNTYCTKCGSDWMYVNKRSTYAMCDYCQHVVTTLR